MERPSLSKGNSTYAGFPYKAIVLTTLSHFHVKRTYASIRGLVVRTITLDKTRISAIGDYWKLFSVGRTSFSCMVKWKEHSPDTGRCYNVEIWLKIGR